MDDDHGCLGLIRYVGPSVNLGYLDAAKSAQALLGLDEALRYYVGAQSPELADADYEIPVRIEKGSWQALIPQTIGEWIVTGLGMSATTYAVAAAQQMAKNDFREIGIRQVFVRSLEAIQWSFRIGKHLRTLTKRSFENVRWRKGNTEVGIPNEAGQLLFIPVDALRLFEHMPAGVLTKITSVVTEERHLEVVVCTSHGDEIETVGYDDKAIFCPVDASVVLPGLKHGAPFNQEGLVTRGNENTNSVGFLYEGHILTCYPEEGSIVRFKAALFVKSRMTGTVSREDKFGEPTELKPRIVFTDVTPLEEAARPEDMQQSLLFDEDAQ